MLCRDSEEPACGGNIVTWHSHPATCPGTLAGSPERSEGSRCEESTAQFLPSSPAEALTKVGMVQSFVSITRVAVQTVSEPEICHGAEF